MLQNLCWSQPWSSFTMYWLIPNQYIVSKPGEMLLKHIWKKHTSPQNQWYAQSLTKFPTFEVVLKRHLQPSGGGKVEGACDPLPVLCYI